MSKSKIEVLDSVFSEFIRLSGADYRGFNKCFTCGKTMHWKELQCGHFVSRRHMSLRFDPKNCKPQCNDCNCTKSGNLEVYRKRLEIEFGLPHLWYLDNKKSNECHWSDIELDIMIIHYRSQVRELKKNC